MKGCRFAFQLAGLLGFYCLTSTATTIDFSGIPDGTLLTAGNPYAGILSIEGQLESRRDACCGPPGYVVEYRGPVTIKDERLWAAFPPAAGWGGPDTHFNSEVQFSFAQPVTDLSFDIITAWWGVYTYTAVNGLGQTITGVGVSPQGFLHSGGIGYDPTGHTTVIVPNGVYLTSLKIGTGDSRAANASMLIDNISFTVPVPETGNTAAFWALACGVLFSLPGMIARR